MTCLIILANAWFRVDRRHTCDHRVDASIRTMKYQKGPDNGWMGPQISPWIRSRNWSGSTCILRCEGLKISFPVAQDVHTKSEDWGNFDSSKLWPMELLVIFLIIPIPRWPRRSCQVWNALTFWKITLYATCPRVWCTYSTNQTIEKEFSHVPFCHIRHL